MIRISICQNAEVKGYGGPNILSVAYNGLQAKLKESESKVNFVHCAVHN